MFSAHEFSAKGTGFAAFFTYSLPTFFAFVNMFTAGFFPANAAYRPTMGAKAFTTDNASGNMFRTKISLTGMTSFCVNGTYRFSAVFVRTGEPVLITDRLTAKEAICQAVMTDYFTADAATARMPCANLTIAAAALHNILRTQNFFADGTDGCMLNTNHFAANTAMPDTFPADRLSAYTALFRMSFTYFLFAVPTSACMG